MIGNGDITETFTTYINEIDMDLLDSDVSQRCSYEVAANLRRIEGFPSVLALI